MEEKDLERIQKLFADNGYVIENVSVFAREADSAELTNIVRKLNELERKINTGIDYKSLAESCDASVARIKDALSSSETYERSVPEHRATFERALDTIASRFAPIRNYMRAEEMMKEKQEMWFEVRRSIYELGKRTDISDAERTNEALRLTLGASKCEKAYKDAVQFYNEQKKEMSKTIDGINLTEFKNQFFRDLNVLELNTKDSVTAKLAIDETVKELINEVTREMRNAVAFYGITSLQSQHEFEALCKRYGLAKKEGFKKVAEPEVSESSKNTEPKTAEPVVEMRYRDFVSALRKANPEAKILTSFDERFIICDKKGEELVLPAGFEYDPAVGITNKNQLEEGKPLTVGFRPMLTEKTDPKKDLSSKSGKQNEGAGKLLSGVKHKVTQARKAGMSGYVKAMLLCGGVLGVTSAVLAGSAFAIPVGLVGGATGLGLGAGLNALRLAIINATNAKIDEFNVEMYEDPKLSPVQRIEKMSQALKSLKEMYRVNQAKKARENIEREQASVETSELDAVVEPESSEEAQEPLAGEVKELNPVKLPLGPDGLPLVTSSVVEEELGMGGR